VRLVYLEGGRDRAVVEGREDSVVRLTDGRFLRLAYSLFIDHDDEDKLKVLKSVLQYQCDAEGERWIVRYDYLRHPAEPHPGAHVQIRGTFIEHDVTPLRGTLERVHFPTARISIEAVIRLLVEQFGVPQRTDVTLWRAVLAASEEEFLRIAHRDISGPRE
jgi:hypothetical protein